MACKAIFVTLFVLIAVSAQALAGRDIPKTDDKEEKPSKNVGVEQSDFLFKKWFHHPSSPDNSVLIPGVGRIMVPPGKSFPQYDPYSHARARSYPPYTGYTGSTPYSGGSPNYVPGGDDTAVPNPGVEVPAPRIGAAPEKAQLTKAQPAKTQPGKAQPTKTQPAKVQPAKSQP